MNKNSDVTLRKEIGLLGAIFFVVGNTIGSGIFISPKLVLEASGSVGLCLTVWAVGGVIQMGCTLCYAELSTLLPLSGGAYTYIKHGVGNFPAFVYVMRNMLFYNPASMVVMMLTSARYLLVLLAPGCEPNLVVEKIVTLFLLMSLLALNAYSTRLANHVALAATAAKLVALAAIIAGGIFSLCFTTISERSDFNTGFSGTSNDPSSVVVALYAAMYTYSGSENLNMIVEEVRNPRRVIPLASVIGLLLVMAVNILTNVSYLAVLSRSEILNSSAVGVDLGERVFPFFPWLVPLAVSVSALGSALVSFQADARLVFAAARDKNVPEAFSYIQVHNYTPLCAMIASAVMAAILVTPSDVSSFLSLLGFLKSGFEALVFVSLILLRVRAAKEDSMSPASCSDGPAIELPLLLPIAMLVIQLYMFLAPLVISPTIVYFYAAAWVVGGSTLLYILFVLPQTSLPFYDKLVKCMQLLLQVSPPTDYIRSHHQPSISKQQQRQQQQHHQQ